jgi:hypothetical protein
VHTVGRNASKTEPANPPISHTVQIGRLSQRQRDRTEHSAPRRGSLGSKNRHLLPGVRIEALARMMDWLHDLSSRFSRHTCGALQGDVENVSRSTRTRRNRCADF